MTAKEIRAINLTRDSPVTPRSKYDTILLQEIAAQLAELNERNARIDAEYDAKRVKP